MRKDGYVNSIANALKSLFGPTGGWKRQAGVLAGVTLVSASLVIAADKPKLKDSKPQKIVVTARALPGFDKTARTETQFGSLTWRGGIELSSPSKNFGGWSGLRLDAKGKGFLAISDAGTWMRGMLKYEDGRVVGLTGAEIGPLKALNGKRLARRRDRDAEAFALLKGSVDNGVALIAFEQNDRVGVFPVGKNGVGKPKRYLRLPKAIRKNRKRDGVEALAVLRGGKRRGAIMTFLEGHLTGDNRHRGWLLHRGKAHKISLKDKGGFSITDLASLSDGSVVVLERRFRWSEGVKMRLRYLEAKDIKPGARLVGKVLLEADMEQEIDNMEGLSVHQNTKGETIITLISDDNFNALFQRTLLLQFALNLKTKSKSVTAAKRH